jgi:hypothetical protein
MLTVAEDIPHRSVNVTAADLTLPTRCPKVIAQVTPGSSNRGNALWYSNEIGKDFQFETVLALR